MYRAFCSYLISAFLFRWIASFHWIPTKMTMNASSWFLSTNFCSCAFYGQQRSLDISVNKKGSNATRKIPAGSAGRNARKGVRNRDLWIDVWAWWMLAGLARHQHRGRGVFWLLWPGCYGLCWGRQSKVNLLWKCFNFGVGQDERISIMVYFAMPGRWDRFGAVFCTAVSCFGHSC